MSIDLNSTFDLLPYKRRAWIRNIIFVTCQLYLYRFYSDPNDTYCCLLKENLALSE